ncbi:microtubule-associated proteins 70-1 [Striga asiatica]|uniref:Microtubule-associated proteins 70-1 n=1 Tax=Striga asiatica TaxID=4170 RepID=A0A5A7QBK7_STRAF|nr:microtubule-associated proteins 70-1 [Striga asiatica]
MQQVADGAGKLGDPIPAQGQHSQAVELWHQLHQNTVRQVELGPQEATVIDRHRQKRPQALDLIERVEFLENLVLMAQEGAVAGLLRHVALEKRPRQQLVEILEAELLLAYRRVRLLEKPLPHPQEHELIPVELIILGENRAVGEQMLQMRWEVLVTQPQDGEDIMRLGQIPYFATQHLLPVFLCLLRAQKAAESLGGQRKPFALLGQPKPDIPQLENLVEGRPRVLRQQGQAVLVGQQLHVVGRARRSNHGGHTGNAGRNYDPATGQPELERAVQFIPHPVVLVPHVV